MVRGQGASAQVKEDGSEARHVRVGSARFLNVDENHALFDLAQDRAGEGETIVWVGREDAVIGFMALRDKPASTSAEALQRLKVEDVRAAMLSGDNQGTVQAIASELGVGE
jgi:P-type E1-E2 ATPase